MNASLRTLVSATIIWLVVLATAGCSSLNQRTGLRADDDLPALAGHERAATAEAPFLVTTHDRRHWAAMTVVVPILTTEVQPNYGSSDSLLRRSPRQRGKYPSAATALDVSASAMDEAGEAVIAPFQFAGELVAAPFWMLLGRWPWNVENSPESRYERLMRSKPEYASQWIELE